MKNLKYILYTFFVAAVISCTYDFPEETKIVAGTADFTKYVAVGNSLTAGYMDGALYTRGQTNSFPAILAKQMELVGGGEFNQPDINSVNGFYTLGPNNTPLGRLKLNAQASPAPTPGDFPTAYAGDKSKLNNFGVPGITLLTALIPQTGGPSASNPAYNALYARFASNPGVSTIIGDAKAALTNGGTFFSFWLGNNDVLGYATGGAANPAILTSTSDFETRFNSALGQLLSVENVKGVVANIPNVTDIPFFTTINASLANARAQPFTLTAAQAFGLNSIYLANGFNSPNFSEGSNNYFVITLGDGTVRQMDPTKDLLTLPFGQLTSQLSSGLGTANTSTFEARPIANHYVLDNDEVTTVRNTINSYNTIISNAVTMGANSSRLAFVDINAIFGEIAKGTTTTAGINFTASIAPPFGAFSLDGVHPNARGSAFIANQFINAINKKFGSTIPQVNPNNYPGNDLPQ